MKRSPGKTVTQQETDLGLGDGPKREVPSLRDLFWAHRGLLSDKWEQYLPIYESQLRLHLERGAPVTLLEIGVENGGSLEIWHKLFPPKSLVIGLDINERCRALKLSEGVEVHVGDATERAFLDKALGDTCFDIIIDDGSHRSKDVVASFEILFERLKPGGLYFVEDLHTSYWQTYGGGFRAKESSIEWAKGLVDAVNADHIENPSELPSDELARLRVLNTHIAEIAFFDSVLVLRKYLSAKDRPFARLMTGDEAPVHDPVPALETVPDATLGNWMLGPALTARLDSGLKQRIEKKEQELKRQEQEIARQGAALEERELELMELHKSTSWKVTAPHRGAKNFLKFCSAFLGRPRH